MSFYIFNIDFINKIIYDNHVGGEIALRNGSHIAVIGGGPSGSLFAHFAFKYANEKGLNLKITIFDNKDFLQKGPKGCNLCAGIIAESLNHKLKEEGIYIPEKRIINRLDGYCLHLKKDESPLRLTCAENKLDCIATVYRGSGPRFSRFPEVISFDDFLLTWAQDMGAEWKAYPVHRVELPSKKPGLPVIYYGNVRSPQTMEVDLVVGACGVNSALLHRLEALDFGYRAPQTLSTYQAEFKVGKSVNHQLFENYIHVYMLHSSPLRYATFIPKGDYLALTLIGKKDLDQNSWKFLLKSDEIDSSLRAYLMTPNCRCFPRITISSARQPYYHRLVIIGDASSSRHYKNGLESALITADLAAKTAVFRGISREDFRQFYHSQAKRLIARDNLYGRWLFALNNLICSNSRLMEIHLNLARPQPNKNPRLTSKLRSIIWNMFTGNIPYRQIWKDLFDLKLQRYIFSETVKFFIKRLWHQIKTKL